MAKVRVHELAKEFNIENKEVLEKLKAAGLAVKTHSSSVYADEARAALKGSGEAVDAPVKKRRPGMMIRKKKKAPEVENRVLSHGMGLDILPRYFDNLYSHVIIINAPRVTRFIRNPHD